MAVAKVIEISSSSEQSFEDAIAKASETVHGIKGAWIKEQKVDVSEGGITDYRVDLKVSFVLD